jgi:hypothetical protein
MEMFSALAQGVVLMVLIGGLSALLFRKTAVRRQNSVG